MGRRTKLRTLCKTGWGARADSLCTFKLSFDVILKALEVLPICLPADALNLCIDYINGMDYTNGLDECVGRL